MVVVDHCSMKQLTLKKKKKAKRVQEVFLSADPTPFPTLQSNTSTSVDWPPSSHVPLRPHNDSPPPDPRAAAVRSVPAGTHSLLSDVSGDFFCSSSKNAHLKFKFLQPCFMQ